MLNDELRMKKKEKRESQNIEEISSLSPAQRDCLEKKRTITEDGRHRGFLDSCVCHSSLRFERSILRYHYRVTKKKIEINILDFDGFNTFLMKGIESCSDC